MAATSSSGLADLAELNALNAAFAVIAFKKTLGFYAGLAPPDSINYTIATNDVANEGCCDT